ncbi:MAG: Tripartite-type tricarboxylate transporter, receptor component TctC [Noviherbaspirillum sp.]|jgi:tripartite-type tricarboxylate transporter receptor subunit TctC|nr:Tripartite-type tricarboxylate transporter, receptor component TctC [Noviherbaspirillum sp.]
MKHKPDTAVRPARRNAGAKLLGLGLAAATVFLGATPLALAQDAYPSKPIKIIVPFPPGGSSDAVVRLVAQRLQDTLKQPVIVENRAGANGSLGITIAAKSEPDGYTALFTDRGSLSINPHLYKKLGYDPLKDLRHVGIVVWAPYVLVAHSSFPASNVSELVSYAKKNPGKVNYASFGNGSMAQMGMESFNERFGIDTVHIPYKGGGPAAAAAMAGEVELTLATIGVAAGNIKAGRLKALAISGNERSPQLPQVPTIVQSGGGVDTIPSVFFGFSFPARTPDAVANKFAAEVKRIVAMPDISEKLISQGYVIGKMSPQDMAETITRDVAEFGKLAKKLRIEQE